MGWFSEVPNSLTVAGHEFLSAGEALDLAEESRHGRDITEPSGERPSPNWPAVRVLVLARLQLEQAMSILSTELGIDARVPHKEEGHEATGAVLERLAQVDVRAAGAGHRGAELGPDQPVA